MTDETVVGVLTILPDGVRIPVREGETMTDACRRYGYSIRTACREGGCGDCLLRLVTGRAMYGTTVSPSVLPRQDGTPGACLPCRAQLGTDATIQLKRSDRLCRMPFSDRLVARDLVRLGLDGSPAR